MSSELNESPEFHPQNETTNSVEEESDDSSIHSNTDSYHSMTDETVDQTVDQSADKVRDISKLRDGKLLKEVIRKGFGWATPRFGEEVRVHYVGKLCDGTVFDSSRDRDELFLFRVGRNEFLAGWDIALRTMKKGEISKFTIAPELAYGESGLAPNVPPNATLVYEIELFDWKLLDCTKNLDKGVQKRIIECGIGHEMPNMCSKCQVRIIGKYGKQVFDDRTVTFTCGQALDSDLIEAIDLAVCRMKKAETSEVIVKPQYAFDDQQCAKFNIPIDYEQLIYEVTLIDFDRTKETYEMDESDKVEQSESAKSIGTKYFKEAKYSSAIRQYKRIHKIFGSLEYFSDNEIKVKRDQLLLAAYLNLALTYLKLNEGNLALKYSNLALKLDANNVKALFRRGLANFNLNNYEEASHDFITVLGIEPTNKSARNQMTVCKDAIRKHTETEKSLYSKMFATQSSKPSDVTAKMLPLMRSADDSCECGTSLLVETPLNATDSLSDQNAL